jgi:hypothetical protein
MKHVSLSLMPFLQNFLLSRRHFTMRKPLTDGIEFHNLFVLNKNVRRKKSVEKLYENNNNDNCTKTMLHSIISKLRLDGLVETSWLSLMSRRRC